MVWYDPVAPIVMWEDVYQVNVHIVDQFGAVRPQGKVEYYKKQLHFKGRSIKFLIWDNLPYSPSAQLLITCILRVLLIKYFLKCFSTSWKNQWPWRRSSPSLLANLIYKEFRFDEPGSFFLVKKMRMHQTSHKIIHLARINRFNLGRLFLLRIYRLLLICLSLPAKNLNSFDADELLLKLKQQMCQKINTIFSFSKSWKMILKFGPK